MRLLIDTDIILYRNLFALKDANYYKQLRSCENMIEKICDRLESNDTSLFLSGSDNFRYKIYPHYKSGRGERPQYLHDARNYFIKYWGAICTSGFEADDLIAMNHDENSIVVSTDKDFNQLPGNQYNPVSDILYYIDNPEFHFYKQMLTGDQIDSIPGVLNPTKSHYKIPPNFTEKTASEELMGRTKEEMKKFVQDMYKNEYGDSWFKIYDRNARLIFLLRDEKSNYYEYY